MSFFKCPSPDHWIEVIKTLGEMNEKSDPFADVNIHCKNKIIVRANRSVLASCSGLLAKLFSLENSMEILLQFVPIKFDLICPDVESEMMRKILKLIYSGSVIASNEEIEEMKSILVSLEMDKLRQQLEVQHQPAVLNPAEVPEDESLIKFYIDLEKEQVELLKSENVAENNPMVDPIENIWSDPIVEKKPNPIVEPMPNSIEGPKQNPVYTCEHCSANFPLKIALKKHLIQRHKLGNGTEKSIPAKSKITQRVKKEKPTKDISRIDCHLCTKSFTQKSDLLRHIAWTHFKKELRQFSGSSKLECGICKVVCTREVNLIRHLAYSHKILDDQMLSSKGNLNPKKIQSGNEHMDVTNQDEFVCLTCKARFALESGLRQHVSEAHQQQPEVLAFDNHECGLCNQLFAAKDELHQHLLSDHKDSAKAENCNEEEMVFE